MAQRRRRVFVVASAREGFCPEQVLFEFEGVRRDTAPSRETGQATTDDTGTGFTPSSFGAYGEGVGTLRSTGGDLGGGSETLAVCGFHSNAQADQLPTDMRDTAVSDTLTKSHSAAVATAFAFDSLASNSMKSPNPHSGCREVDLSKALDTGRGLDPSCNQGGIGVLTYSPAVANPLGVSPSTHASPNVASGQGDVIVFDCYNQTCDPHVAKTVAARNDQDTTSVVCIPVDTQPPIGIDEEWDTKVDGFGTLKARMSGGGFQGSVMQPNLQVRRLTPVECHRLQGFPDDHCKIPWRGKSAEDCPDSPQYKALGNSMAVPCMEFIGKRIDNLLFGDFEI